MCSVESAALPFQGRGIQLVIAGMGPGGVRAIRIQIETVDGRNARAPARPNETPTYGARGRRLPAGHRDELIQQNTDQPMLGSVHPRHNSGKRLTSFR